MHDHLLTMPAISSSDALISRKSKSVMPCVYHFYKDPPVITRGEGCYLYDQQGKAYLDCFSGVSVMNAGHCNPEIINPAIKQIQTLQHTTTIYLTEPYIHLTEVLAEISPGELNRSFLCASGSEATEAAMLIATLYTGKPGIVATTNGLHGRTRWAINATGIPMWRTDPNPLDDMYHVPYGDLNALEAMFSKRDDIAAFVMEPIQGNGGIQIPPDEYLPDVRALCDRYDVLLILDEIQTGMNRTGKWFACEHWGVTPDIIAMSKALGNGFPIAAMITTEAIAMSYTRPGASTYGGNPVCATAALSAIEYHQKHDLATRATIAGNTLLYGLQRLCENTDRLVNVRGKGLMIGMDVVKGDEPDPELCDLILELLKDEGILAGKTGIGRNVLTFMPPLTISGLEIDSILKTLDDVISVVMR